jgi:hypothetical protein
LACLQRTRLNYAAPGAILTSSIAGSVEQFLEYLRCVLEPFDDLFPEDQLSFRQTICEILPGRFHQLRIIRAVFDDLAARTAEISAEEQALRPVVFGVEWR